MVVPEFLLGGLVGVQTASWVWSSGLLSSGVTTCRDTWGEVATGLEESPSGVVDEAPKATDVGLFGVVFLNPWLEVSSTTCESSCLTSVVMLMQLSTLVGYFRVRWEGEAEGEVPHEAEASGTWSPGVTWKSSTRRSASLQLGCSNMLTLWASNPDREVITSSKPPFSPSRYTTQPSNCKSWHISSWQRCPHAFLLGSPLVMALRWPSEGSRRCGASLLNCA